MATYKRSIFVVDPKFQYKFCFYVCSLVLLSSMIYPLTIYDLYEKLIAMQPASQKMNDNRDALMLVLTLTQMAVLGIVFVITVFLSHKIAGPMYKLKSFLSNLREGKEYTPLYFRAGDNFQDVAEEVNKYVEFCKDQHAEDFKYLEEVSAYIANLSLVIPEDKKPVLNEILSKLAEIQSKSS